MGERGGKGEGEGRVRGHGSWVLGGRTRSVCDRFRACIGSPLALLVRVVSVGVKIK